MAAPVAQTGAGNVTTTPVTAGTSITVTKPSSIADGDLFVGVIYSSNTTVTFTPPSGWTNQGGQNTNRTVAVFTKPIPSAAAESAPDYAWTWSGSSRALGIIFRVTGANLAAPVDVFGTAVAIGAVATMAAPSVTTVQPATLLLSVDWTQTTAAPVSAMSPPGSMSTVGSVSTAPAATSALQVEAETLSVAGATGTRTESMSPTPANAGALMLALDPPPSSLPAVGAVHRRACASVRRARSVSPSFDQLAPPPPPSASSGPDKTVLRGMLRRRGRITAMPRPQPVPPSPPRPHRPLLARRRPVPARAAPAQAIAPAPPQYPAGAQRPHRTVLWSRQRRTSTPVPAQVAATPPPPYPVWVFRVHRVVTGQRRGRAVAPVPPQAAAPAAPVYVPQLRAARRALALTRRGRSASPVASQLAPPPKPAQRRRVFPPIRRGDTVSPVRPQSPPPAYPRQPIRRRLVALLLRRPGRQRFPVQPGNPAAPIPKAPLLAPGRRSSSTGVPGDDR